MCWKDYTYLFVKAISNCSSSRFINDTKNFQSSNDSCILSSLPLEKIVKIEGVFLKRRDDITFENHWSKLGLSPLLCYNYDQDKLRPSPSFWSKPSKKSPQGRKFYFRPCIPLPIWVFLHRWQPKKSAIFELLRSKNNWNSLISEPQKYLKYLNFRAKITYFYLERPMFHVTLDGSILKLPSNQSFGIWKNEYHLDYWSTISSAIYLEMIWTSTFMCGQ